MRILQISSARRLGGGETHVIELVQTLRRLGHTVVVAGRPSGPLNPDIALPFLNSADFLSALRLRSILKSEHFDVVHAHVARDYTVVAAAAWGVADVKLVFTRHLLLPVKRHALYRRVDGWLAPTSQILKTLEHLRPKRTAVIPNWVDVKKFDFRPKDLHQPVTLGLLGQISPHKGHDDAIDALARLGSGFELRLAGKGDAAYEQSLRSRARDLPVTFMGFVSLPEFFQMVDVLMVPSWEEPFGIVLLEAMATGIPVVSTARGGPLDIIRSGTHGLLVEPRDSAALADAVKTLVADDLLRRSIIENARKRAEQEYDITTVIPRIVKFYQELL
jgi:glycosyltransferase involved in cell wall biosynthesis